MNKCISFYKSLGNTAKQVSDPAKWDKAVKLFEEKKFKESFYATLGYIDENLINKFSNPEKTVFNIPQGSVVVTITIQGDTIFLSTPFVKIPQTKFMPIFRRCTELNFAVMTLPQIIIKDDFLVFEYKMPLDTCEPYKLYSALRDMALNADKYDDEFIEKYGAERIIEPLSTPLSADKMEACLTTIKAIAKEALTNSAYFEEKRNLTNACDAIFIGMKQIDYYCEPSGMFYKKLQDCVDNMFDRNKDILAKMKPGKQFLASIEKMTAEDLSDAVFYNYCLISIKRNMSRNGLSNWIEDLYDSCAEYYKKDNFLSCGYLSLYTFYTILADFNLDEHTQKAIEYVLKTNAGKEFNDESCQVFLDLMDFFYDSDEEIYPNLVEENEPTSTSDAEAMMKNVMEQYQGVLGGFMKMFGK